MSKRDGVTRITKRDFDGGLSVSCPPDVLEPNKLRRACGLNAVRTKSMRSRNGSEVLYTYTAPAHSLHRFNGTDFHGVGTVLYRNGVSVLTGLSGATLYFASMPPTLDKEDYLFVSGGGALYKVDKLGAVSNWGIDPPSNGFTAAKGTRLYKAIEAFDNAAAWAGTSVTLADEATIKHEGTNSMKCTLVENVTGYCTKNNTIDLSMFSAVDDSTKEDFITFWIRVDFPDNLDMVQLDFSLGNTTFAADVFTQQFNYTRDEETETGAEDVAGFGDHELVDSPETEADTTANYRPVDAVSTDIPQTPNTRRATYDGSYNGVYQNVLQKLQQGVLPPEQNRWKRMRIAKNTFKRQGEGNYGWDDVQAVKFTFKTNTNGGAVVYLDDLRMIGGAGLLGNYKYHITFKNSSTGHRSNPNSTAVMLKNVKRQPVALANLPVSADTQVDFVEIWRTVGNGALFWKAGEVANGTTTFDDDVADGYFLDSRDSATVLGTEELPLDNIKPEATFGVVVGPYNASLFWLSKATGKRGRVYYSPIGRPEACTGFVNVSNDSDNALQMLCLWNGALYAFSKERVYLIYGNNPYLYREVQGVPGTKYPGTVVGTPQGIAYQAVGGVRLFNGASAPLMGFDALSKIFRGESISELGLSAFVGTAATFARDEYIISNGVNTFAHNMTNGTWRECGVGFGTLYYESDVDVLAVAGGDVGNGVWDFDKVGMLDDGGEAIVFDVEVAHERLSSDKLVVVDRVLIDVNTGGQALNVEVLLDGVVRLSTCVVCASRMIHELSLDLVCNYVGVRLYGSLTAQVEMFGVEYDVRPC